ncbi:MAG: adenosylcobinamide-GDP ribazoletransferase [Candidatus Accumulibacter sp.]|jgi:adenosylcobinamide-GDP ribazoletransferase|nr:adenosylcobinamide-GDP ribazoletransferase [Accumulibacter sp.]
MPAERSELETFLGAVRFFTRLPVPEAFGQDMDDPAARTGIMRYFPAVGLVVGVLAGLAFAVTFFFWPKTLAVLAAIAIAMLVTGARHENGWGATVDAFCGGGNRGQVLAGLRESGVGRFGVVALILLLLARFFALIEVEMQLVPVALIAGHAVSRLCSVCVFHLLGEADPESAPENGQEDDRENDRKTEEEAAPSSGGALGRNELILAAVAALLPVLLLSPLQTIPALLFAAAATFWLWRLFRRRIGGHTAECLSAVQQLSEVAFYSGLLCALA